MSVEKQELIDELQAVSDFVSVIEDLLQASSEIQLETGDPLRHVKRAWYELEAAYDEIRKEDK